MMQRILLICLVLFVGVVAQAELQYASVTEDDLVAGRFLPLPEHLRNAGYFNDEFHDTRGETFEDTIVEGIQACQAQIDVSSFGITTANIKSLYYAVINKHPELFYITTLVRYNYYSSGAVAFVFPEYITTDAATIASQQAEIDVAREQALSMVPAGATELEKALILHDYLATHCDYDQTLSRTNTRNIYGALVEKSVVCAGYAVTYEYLLSYVGVSGDYVSSDAMNHAWNMVTLGGQKYHVDVTWDDPTWYDGKVRRNYVAHENFLRSDSGIVATGHTSWDDPTIYTSPSTKYDSYFWQEIKEQIPCLNGKGYAFDVDGDLKQYVLSTGEADATLLHEDDIWFVWDGGGYYYTDNYSSVVRFGQNLIYSCSEEFKLYDLIDESCKSLPTVSVSTEYGYIYGIQHESPNLIAAKIAQSPNDVGNYTDIALYPVTGITLSKSSLSLKTTDAPVALTATVAPSNATYPELRWSSSNPSVATVSASGVVSVVGKGTATITAEAKDNGVKATSEVTVTDGTVAVTGVTLDREDVSLVLGKDTLQLNATVAPADATNKSVSWSSSNPSVVAVSSTGLVTPVAKGNAVITVTTTDGSFKDTCSVTVTVAVTGVTLDKEDASLVLGKDTLQLNATVVPADATNKSVSWSSSNPSVATVSSTGLVTPVAKGNAVITVTTADGSFKDTCTVTVTQPVTSVALDQTAVSMKVGDEALQLAATVSPENASDKSVFWSSTDESVATVVNGLVTVVGPGSAAITVTTTDGGKTATCAVTVTQPVTSVALDQTAVSMKVGDAPLQLTATVSPENASDKSVSWSSTDESVATVVNGLVTAVGPGSATITVTTADGGKTATCGVTVTQPVTSVALDQSAVSMKVGDAPLQLTATVSPENASDKSVNWSSTDEMVAMVVDGLVTAVGPGSATITVTTTDGGKTATCAVTVTQPVTSVALNQSAASMKVGDAPLPLTATVSPDNASDKSVSWSSTDETVATVVNGLVTAVGPGSATITVTTADGGKTATCGVTVTQPVTGVALNQSAASMKVGDAPLQLTATVSPENASDKSVSWSSTDESVATVVNGLVTPVGAGSADITVTTADGAFTATCGVTVIQPVTGVALNQSAASMKVGDAPLQLTAMVSPENASDKSVNWSSTDDSVATVVDGLVTAVGPGSATITVTTTDGGKTATCGVTVTQPVAGVALNQSVVAMKVGDAPLQLSATVSPENASDKSVSWSSTNESVATVVDGLVTAVGPGSATITVTTTDGGKTATCGVTVIQPVTSVALDQTAVSMKVGDAPLQLTATVSPDNASDKSVSWSSTDESVATVVDGLVTAVGAGSADITVTTADGSFIATCHTSVVYPPNTLFLKAGWNLVAFRKAPSNLSQFAELYFFICQNGQYVQTMAFAKYQAYWVRSDEEQAIVYDCDETRGDDEIVITSEWQFIGISDEESVGMDRTNLECQKWQDGCFQKVEAKKPLELGRGYLMRKCE